MNNWVNFRNKNLINLDYFQELFIRQNIKDEFVICGINAITQKVVELTNLFSSKEEAQKFLSEILEKHYE